jgi:pimeloyl-ACP methyl ester carboxylesterase
MLGSPCLKVDRFLHQIMMMWKDLRRLDPVLWAREVTFWCYAPDTFNERPELAEAAARARGAEQTFPQAFAFDRLVEAYCAYDATGRASSIKCPTLIANASEFDLITGPRFAHAVHRAIPHSRLHIFENTSHNFWVEAFEDWWALTRDFFQANGDD